MKKVLCNRCGTQTEKTKTVMSDGTPVMHRVCVKCNESIAAVRGVPKTEKSEGKTEKGRRPRQQVGKV